MRSHSAFFTATLASLMFVITLLMQSNVAIAASTERPENSAEQPTQTAALIITANGTWVVDHDGRTFPVEAGDAIPEGGVLRYTSKEATISGRLGNGERFAYPGQDIVGKPLTAKVIEPENKPWWVAALDALSGPTSEGIAPVVRGINSRTKAIDAVTKLSSDSVDLSPIFSGAKIPFEKELFVVLKKASFDKAGNEARWGPVKVNFTKRNKATVELKGIEAGLYELSICDRSAEHKPTPEGSVIIVSDESDFVSLTKNFRSATNSAKEWKQVPKAKINRILRSYLTVLAKSVESSGSQH